MSNDPNSIQLSMANRGLVLRREVGSLQPGEYYSLHNVTSIQEGSIQTRLGSARLTSDLELGSIHTIEKLSIGVSDATDPRYAGAGQDIWRVTGPYSVSSKVSNGWSLSFDPWEAVSYQSGDGGLATKYFAHPSALMRDSGSFSILRRWGIPVPVAPASCALGSPITGQTLTGTVNTSGTAVTWVSGNTFQSAMVGGTITINLVNYTVATYVSPTSITLSTSAGTQSNVSYSQSSPVQGPNTVVVSTALPYDYCYTFRDPLTGNEGNPSTFMAAGNAVNVQNQQVLVTCWGTDAADITGDPSLSGNNVISVYRRGGTFADGLFRFVGYAANPGISGGLPLSVVFTDSNPDYLIAGNQVLEFDNFMPVPSALTVPFSASLASQSAVGGRFYLLTFSGLPGGATDLTTFMASGSVLTIGLNTGNQEIVQVVSVSTGSLIAYLQNTHSIGDQCSCDTWPYSTCDVVCQSGDAILLAGDPHNPHWVYRSKSGVPTSFPVINEETGFSHIQIVGSPGNPVYGLVDFNGEVVCLNKSKIFTFSIWYGQMSAAMDSGSSRGMVGKHLYAVVDGSIWFLSYDGIYEWNGGESVCRTEAIRTIFDQSGLVLNGMFPLDYTKLDSVSMTYFQKYFYVNYVDTQGHFQTLRCSISDGYRWENSQYAGAGSMSAVYTERDTGRLIAGQSDAFGDFLAKLETGTNDEGNPIVWNLQTGFYPEDGRDVEKLFTDIVVELLNPSDTVTVQMFYDYSSTGDATDLFTIAPSASRQFVELPLQQTGTPKTSAGKQARVAAINISGSSSGQVQIFSIQFKFKVLAEIQRGRVEDWQDLGHPFDKRIYACTIEYDSKGVSETLILDTLSGINGGTETDGVQSLVLSGNRSKQEFPIIDGQIVKMVRLRPQVATSDLMIYDVQWVKEDYPADIVYFTEYDDCGTPYDKYLQQVVLDVNTNGVAVTIQIQADGSTVESISVTSTLSTRSQVITLNTPLKGKKFRLLLTTPLTTGAKFQLWSCKYVSVPADKGPVSHTGDWLDFGSPHDKHLLYITVDYENSGGTLVLQLDALSGTSVTNENDAVFTFTLTGTPSGATSRSKQQVAVPDSIAAAKAFRLRPQSSTVPTNFKIWGWDAKFEEYPPDIVLWTEWRDFEYPYAKYAQQLILDVDTGGATASVQIQNESGTVQTLSVTSTFSTREQILTLTPQMVGFKFKLLITPGAGGKFQMWSWRIGFAPADKGAVTHTFDYDDLGYPYSKRLLNVVLEYDNAFTFPAIVMNMDIVAADGITFYPSAFSFTLNGLGRSKQEFSFPVDTFATLVRFHPSTTITGLKEWKYSFQKVDLPPNTVPATQWSDEGYSCEKILRGIELDMDTGGVACSVALQVDGATAQTFSVTTTATDRVRILSPNSNIIGKLFRLVFTPGGGGKSQFYGVTYQTIKEPCARALWDSYEQNYGAAGWKAIKQLWAEYICPTSVVVSIYRDGDQLFYQTTLPSHAHRDVERFFLPSVNNGALNKSKVYRITIASSDGVTGVKFYRDTSRIEVKELSNDQRSAYAQKVIWEEMPIPA